MKRRLVLVAVVGTLLGGAFGVFQATADPPPQAEEKIALLDCAGNVVGQRPAAAEGAYVPPVARGASCQPPVVELGESPEPSESPEATASPTP